MAISVEHILTRNLSEHLSTPVLLLDEHGALVFFNEAAERIVGRPHDDLLEVGTAWSTLVRTVDAGGSDVDSAALLRPLRGLGPARCELRVRVDDGSVESCTAWSLPLIGRDGELLGAIVSFWPAP